MLVYGLGGDAWRSITAPIFSGPILIIAFLASAAALYSLLRSLAFLTDPYFARYLRFFAFGAGDCSACMVDCSITPTEPLHPGAVVIGSDQVADLAGQPLGKPGDHARATAQLQRMRGHTVVFHTAVAVVCHASGFAQADLAPVRVRFRELSDVEIERYLRAEQPYDCAGSAKSEGLGISLLEAIDSDDPTALIGLPLIRTCRLLRAAGLVLP